MTPHEHMSPGASPLVDESRPIDVTPAQQATTNRCIFVRMAVAAGP